MPKTFIVDESFLEIETLRFYDYWTTNLKFLVKLRSIVYSYDITYFELVTCEWH